MLDKKELEENLKKSGCVNINKIADILTEIMKYRLIDPNEKSINFYKGEQMQIGEKLNLDNITYIQIGFMFCKIKNLKRGDLDILASMLKNMGLKIFIFLSA